MEESVPLEMDNHVLDKEDGCYDNTDATFSDDEEELNSKGKRMSSAAKSHGKSNFRASVILLPFFLRR